MGAMFRSEVVSLCQLFIQPEAGYSSVAQLGEIGVAQFRDLNEELNAFQRKFISEIRRCDEMERKLNYIRKEVMKDEIEMRDLANHEIPNVPNPREFINLEAQFEKTENEVLELSENFTQLLKNHMELTELCCVLERTQSFFADQTTTERFESEGEDPSGNEGGKHLGFVAGVIDRDRILGFERMLWRISRGNVFLRQAEITELFVDPKTNDKIKKNVFVAFFQGEQLKSRIKKVCTGYHASLYPCPNTFEERADMLKGVKTRLEDLQVVINQTKDQRNRVLYGVAKELPKWIIMIKKIKAIYHTMNLFSMDVSTKCLIGECWIPEEDIPAVQKALSDGSAAVGSTIPSFLNVISTDETPPTYNRTNKFTQGFQNLIDAYGVASYREANPALYTIITFPFLFAVMFGDLGHGMIMAMFGAWMVIWEKTLGAKKGGGEIWNIFFGGRYIILLMGLFSCYTGFVYNDIFSKSMNIFGTTWQINYNQTTVMTNVELQLNPVSDDLKTDEIYFIGLDPIWQLATNKIIFLNSYKMKLSIILGVIHMIVGLCVSVVNFNHFKRRASIILEFVPQLLFLLLLFAYLCFLMFFKWIMYSPKSEDPAFLPSCAPSVLIYFINMMLFGAEKKLPGCNEYMFSFQSTLQTAFVLIALLCIPWMLLGKPIYLATCGKHHRHKTADGELESMAEVFIHQSIHTIEYVLSTISHTASYLRLWALSLAHAQLSEVLWNMVLKIGLGGEGVVGIIMLFIIFGAWACLTISILVLMEGLSAFLHTLRLHWVEFMSKHYEGLGHIFAPFSFKAILNESESE